MLAFFCVCALQSPHKIRTIRIVEALFASDRVFFHIAIRHPHMGRVQVYHCYLYLKTNSELFIYREFYIVTNLSI